MSPYLSFWIENLKVSHLFTQNKNNLRCLCKSILTKKKNSYRLLLQSYTIIEKYKAAQGRDNDKRIQDTWGGKSTRDLREDWRVNKQNLLLQTMGFQRSSLDTRLSMYLKARMGS